MRYVNLIFKKGTVMDPLYRNDLSQQDNGMANQVEQRDLLALRVIAGMLGTLMLGIAWAAPSFRDFVLGERKVTNLSENYTKPSEADRIAACVFGTLGFGFAWLSKDFADFVLGQQAERNEELHAGGDKEPDWKEVYKKHSKKKCRDCTPGIDRFKRERLELDDSWSHEAVDYEGPFYHCTPSRGNLTKMFTKEWHKGKQRLAGVLPLKAIYSGAFVSTIPEHGLYGHITLVFNNNIRFHKDWTPRHQLRNEINGKKDNSGLRVQHRWVGFGKRLPLKRRYFEGIIIDDSKFSGKKAAIAEQKAIATELKQATGRNITVELKSELNELRPDVILIRTLERRAEAGINI
jgi:hypothetical protein